MVTTFPYYCLPVNHHRILLIKLLLHSTERINSNSNTQVLDNNVNVIPAAGHHHQQRISNYYWISATNEVIPNEHHHAPMKP